ncbi:MAG: hypothetical protein KGL34_07985 [Gammaproteobacteria bacterium]|nr:hypothetical protein [Gammaproteobacteria bacterium]
MKRRRAVESHRRVSLRFAALMLVSMGSTATAVSPASNVVRLSLRQQAAVGLVVRPLPVVILPQQTPVDATVLDAATALADLAECDAAGAELRAAAAEAARLAQLARTGAAASRRQVETAAAALARARSTSEAANARFGERWAPLDAIDMRRRRAILGAAVAGRATLLRAELAGRAALGALPSTATVTVDGLRLRATVLGAMRSLGGGRGASLMLELAHSPSGLAAGARLDALLQWGRHAGRLVPAGALLYGEDGAYVFQRVSDRPADQTSFRAARVRLIGRHGDQWLVEGLDDRAVVVGGAGVLWSLQGLGPAGDDDDD